MDLNHRLTMSYYQTIGVINDTHEIYLVQHNDTRQICVKKILKVYNKSVYEELFNNPVMGTPRIIAFEEDISKRELTIIEEFVSGVSLQSKIENSEVTLNDIYQYMDDLCSIFEKLHSMNPPIIHRDVKPSNIIITNYNRAMLLDFNAAKNYENDSKTRDTVLLGTQGYAAPEQYGFGASTPQTDIYALGIILKEMASSSKDSCEQFNEIIRKSTELDQNSRYKSVTELKNSILSIQDSNYSKLPPISIWSRLALPGFRTKTPWKMIVACIGYAFIFTLVFFTDIKPYNLITTILFDLFAFSEFMAIILGTCNYMDIHKLMPLCRHKNTIVQILGILLVDVILLLLIAALYFIIALPLPLP